jgi:putative tributyrin esterase
MYKNKIFILFILILAFTFTVNAQKEQPKVVTASASGAATMNLPVKVENHKLDSKLMNREMPYQVILPANYAASDKTKYSVVYLLHGLFGHFDNWASKTKLVDYAKDYNYIIVMPEGNNGWYTDSVSVPNDKYESYIANELIDEVDKKFRTIADREHRAIAGLSMGGYGALKFGIKYPGQFILAGSFSGALAVGSFKSKEELPVGIFRDSVISIFGEADSDTKKSNDLLKLFYDVRLRKVALLPFLYISCGTEDEYNLLSVNRALVDDLTIQKIPHEYRQLPGKHKWDFWDAQVEEFLRMSKKFIKTQEN